MVIEGTEVATSRRGTGAAAAAVECMGDARTNRGNVDPVSSEDISRSTSASENTTATVSTLTEIANLAMMMSKE